MDIPLCGERASSKHPMPNWPLGKFHEVLDY
jgi:hypothetical protein